MRPESNDVDLSYHVEADADFVTLFVPSMLQYNPRDGRYTPPRKIFGYGLHYIEKAHAQNIISDQLRSVEKELANDPSESRRAITERELVVLHRIYDRYVNGIVDRGLARENNQPVKENANFTGIPDKELGDLGEKHIYERELLIASKLDQPASQVKWVSRGNPQSPFDIRSVRDVGGVVRDYYIEVKSTTVLDDTHIFVSAREIAFLDEHSDRCSVVLVRFNPDKSVKDVRDFTIDQLRQRFELVPVSFKLRPLA